MNRLDRYWKLYWHRNDDDVRLELFDDSDELFARAEELSQRYPGVILGLTERMPDCDDEWWVEQRA